MTYCSRHKSHGYTDLVVEYYSLLLQYIFTLIDLFFITLVLVVSVHRYFVVYVMVRGAGTLPLNLTLKNSFVSTPPAELYHIIIFVP